MLRHGRWHRLHDVRDGRIGYGGLVAPSTGYQGTGTTPLGTVRLISAFGRHPRRRRVGPALPPDPRGDYWVEDNGSRFYNRYRNKSQGGFRWWLPSSAENSSERLRDFPVQYEYSIVTSYNRPRCATVAPGSSCTSTAAARPPAASAPRGRSCDG